MVNSKILIRRDLAANWTSANPVLGDGEQGYETDTRKMKIGDGITNWINLPYFSGGASGGETGPTGPTGPTGATGPQGATGPVSAYSFDGGYPDTNFASGPIFDLGFVS
jgi:hypothetical protein